jgi:hypothetical protein
MIAERGIRSRTWVLLVVGLVVALLPFSAAGHDRRVVEGDNRQAYLLESWFRDEPPELNQENALVLAATRTGPAGTGPVLGLEATVRAELRGAGERLPLALTPRSDSDDPDPGTLTGLYEAPFLVTSPGEYRVRLSGEIEGVPVDLALFSHEISPNWLDPLAVPREPVPDRERERQRGERRLAADARTTNDEPLPYVAIVIVTLGLLASCLALWRAARRNSGNAASAGQRPPNRA